LFHDWFELIYKINLYARDTSNEVFHSFKNVYVFYMEDFTFCDETDSFDVLDNELVVLRNETVHVFEREPDMLRAEYEYACRRFQTDKGTWGQAKNVWKTLSPEIQATLITISDYEIRQSQDICEGLLATLHGYQGSKRIKDAFAAAIKSCRLDIQ